MCDDAARCRHRQTTAVALEIMVQRTVSAAHRRSHPVLLVSFCHFRVVSPFVGSRLALSRLTVSFRPAGSRLRLGTRLGIPLLGSRLRSLRLEASFTLLCLLDATGVLSGSRLRFRLLACQFSLTLALRLCGSGSLASCFRFGTRFRLSHLFGDETVNL